MTEQLAELVVRQDFGEKFTVVINAILKEQNIRLGDLIIATKFPFAMLRHILVILVKHNIVLIQTKASDVVPASENDSKINDYFYNVSISGILHRIR